jgi:hypothetical protein
VYLGMCIYLSSKIKAAGSLKQGPDMRFRVASKIISLSKCDKCLYCTKNDSKSHATTGHLSPRAGYYRYAIGGL